MTWKPSPNGETMIAKPFIFHLGQSVTTKLWGWSIAHEKLSDVILWDGSERTRGEAVAGLRNKIDELAKTLSIAGKDV